MTDCPECAAGLSTPLCCEACGVLFSPEKSPTPFEALGFEVAYAVEAKALKKRLLRLSRLTHPDFFATAPADQRALAEENNAILNNAHEILSDDFRRADWIVKALGGPSESDERQMPQAFLMEVLEWNEALEDGRNAAADSSERKALATLQTTLSAERADTLAAVAASLTPTPAPDATADASLSAARKQLNAIRYLDRTLRELREIALEQSA